MSRGFRCTIPVSKTGPAEAQAGQEITWTIKVPSDPDALLGLNCDLVNITVKDTIRTTQGNAIRQLSAAPEFMLGSVHAITETGSLIVASKSGSQLGPYASGAGRVILVVGTQKIVRDTDEGMRRLENHTLPLEDARAQAAYGINSSISKLLIINGDAPSRTTVVLVDEALGF